MLRHFLSSDSRNLRRTFRREPHEKQPRVSRISLTMTLQSVFWEDGAKWQSFGTSCLASLAFMELDAPNSGPNSRLNRYDHFFISLFNMERVESRVIFKNANVHSHGSHPNFPFVFPHSLGMLEIESGVYVAKRLP